MKRQRENEGVSNIIGTLLIFAILVSLYGALQSSAVPVWNKGVEYDHLDVVYADMMSMKSDIEDVALLISPKSSDIHLGVRYPERAIFMNPGEGAAGMLTVESDVNISITSSVTTDEQKLIVGDTVYIPILNLPEAKNLSSSSMDVESLTIHPYTKVSTDLNVKSITITFDTAYPGIWLDEAYRAEFEAQFPEGAIPNELKSRDILGNLSSSVNVSVSGNTITLESSGTSDRIDLPDPDGPVEQPQSNQLYAGVLKCYMGELDPVWYYGETTASMSGGTQWANVPSSIAMTEFNITKILFDVSNPLFISGDYVAITIVDDSGNWWKATIGFTQAGEDTEISYLTAKTPNPEGNVNISTYLHPVTGIPISGAKEWKFDPDTTWIDLLNYSGWDVETLGDARYQNAGIGVTNTLITELYDPGGGERAIIYYMLKIAGG
jgi:hypothetical protein